jgi:hypothetical protein
MCAVLFILWGISFYLYIQLKRRIAEEFKKYNNKFTESGNAVADAMKVAFDNIKKNTRSENTYQTSMTEVKARVHRLEQHISREKVRGVKFPNMFSAIKDKSNIKNKQNERRDKQAN